MVWDEDMSLCTGVNLSGHVRLSITSKVFSRAAKIDRKSMKERPPRMAIEPIPHPCKIVE